MDETRIPLVVDFSSVQATEGATGPLWTLTSEDLNINLLRFAAGQGIAPHVNAEVDVLLVAIAGEGTVEVDGTEAVLRSGQACLIPKGAERAIRVRGESFAYLSCHRRRGGLWPL